MTQDVIKHKTVLMKNSAPHADTATALKDSKFFSHQAERTSCLYYSCCWKCLPFTMWRSRNSIDDMALPIFLHLKRLRVDW